MPLCVMELPAIPCPSRQLFPPPRYQSSCFPLPSPEDSGSLAGVSRPDAEPQESCGKRPQHPSAAGTPQGSPGSGHAFFSENPLSPAFLVKAQQPRQLITCFSVSQKALSLAFLSLSKGLSHPCISMELDHHAAQMCENLKQGMNSGP